MPATLSESFWAWIVEQQKRTTTRITRRFMSDLLLTTDYTDQLLIFPLRNASRCPWGASGLELFLELIEIDFDQLPQLAQHALEVLGCGVVLRDLCLSRTRD